jgi:hypothetical protein
MRWPPTSPTAGPSLTGARAPAPRTLLQAFNGIDGFAAAEGPTDWQFVSFNVSSPSDLQAMRAQLGGSVEYFERDLTARIMLPRGLMAAAPANASASASRNASSHQGSSPAATTAGSQPSAEEDKLATIQPVPSEPARACLLSACCRAGARSLPPARRWEGPLQRAQSLCSSRCTTP